MAIFSAKQGDSESDLLASALEEAKARRDEVIRRKESANAARVALENKLESALEDPVSFKMLKAEIRDADSDVEFFSARVSASEKEIAALEAGILQIQKRADYDRVKEERDALAKRIQAHYPTAAKTIFDLIRALNAMEPDLARVNNYKLPDCEPLWSAEYSARGGYDISIASIELPNIDGKKMEYWGTIRRLCEQTGRIKSLDFDSLL